MPDTISAGKIDKTIFIPVAGDVSHVVYNNADVDQCLRDALFFQMSNPQLFIEGIFKEGAKLDFKNDDSACDDPSKQVCVRVTSGKWEN